ncbi:MAG TPA: YceI family protein [Terriglobales bacterium]|nr:YceI family protein [Terriglobales bacterium]
MTTNATQTAISTWKLDPAHAAAEFKIKHMMISNVKGHFTALSGSLTLDEADITRSRVEATIETASIDTREPQRDAHLKSADFFDVAQFPAISFRSTSVKRNGPDTLDVAGDLTIHGVTREVVLRVEGPTPPSADPWGNTRIGLTATARINRKHFGLTWNAALETGGILVGDDVSITIDAEFIKS